MKNTIYNAIQKQLVIDDGDPSISYKHSEIDSEVKLLALEELNEIHKKNCWDVLDYCTSGCLVYILSDNTEVSIDQYDLKMHGDPLFLKIMTPKLTATDNEILIACHNRHYIKSYKAWKEPIFKHDIFIDERYKGLYGDELDKKAALDINGYDKCLKLKQLLHNFYTNNKNYMQALLGCMNSTINSNGIKYQGYLPAIGQMMVLSKYIDLINFALTHCHCNKITMGPYNVPYWSCSEYCNDTVCIVNGDGKAHTKDKSNPATYTLPFFKKIN